MDSYVPVQVVGLPNDVVAAAAGITHSLALTSSGDVWAWGYNGSFGNLGNGSTAGSLMPVKVSGLTGMIAVSGGLFHSLAVKSDGTVWAWGLNDSGQLGNGSTVDSPVALQVSVLTSVVAVVAADECSLAVKSDGTVWAWGNNYFGELGNSGTDSHVPVQVSGPNGVGFLNLGSAAPPVTTISLIDPVPTFVSGGGITASSSDLATAIQSVKGVAADGAAQIIVRVSGTNAGDAITLTMLDENGNPTVDSCGEGYLGALPGGGSCSGATGGPTTITAKNNGSGPATAFAVYHAPQDFVRAGNATDPGTRTRTVSIQAVYKGSTITRSVQIFRPPVVLVHGIWGSDNDWLGSNGVSTTLQSTGNFTVSFGHYDQPIALKSSVPNYNSANTTQVVSAHSLGFSYGATQVLPQIQAAIADYKQANQVAAVQADVVGHSMGGDVARTLPQMPGYLDQYNYGLGVVHKLITIGTPHQGSPLATDLLQSSNQCVRSLFSARGLYAFSTVTSLSGATINGGVGDLQPTSSAVSAIHTGSAIIPTAMIGAQLSSGQLAGAGGLSPSWGYVLTTLCGAPTGVSDPLALALNPTGWPALFVSPTNPAGASDGIVPLSSAFDGESSYAQRLPFVITNAVHNSAAESLGFGPPGELDQASGIPTDVLQLLNTPVSNSVFELKP